MKKAMIGYIYSDKKLKGDEKAFIKVAKKKNVGLIFFNLLENFDEIELEKKAKKCDIFYNNSSEPFALEFLKTLEALGKKVIDSSKIGYYIEDKWMFYLKCKKNKIPIPKTILLSENLNFAKKDLKKFNHWPVILKRIEGTWGDYVDKADNLNDAGRIIKHFWKKGSEKKPIIAQEFIHSPSYRITTIGDKIVQTAIKKNYGWKCTGVYEKKYDKFKIDSELNKIIKKLLKIIKINVCGIDLIKKQDKWIVLEVNSSPGLDFFEKERNQLVEKIIDLLLKKLKQKVIK